MQRKIGLCRKFSSRMNSYSTLRVDGEGGGIRLSPNRCASLGVIHADLRSVKKHKIWQVIH
ncbi:MAG: hypothetical protein LBJ60_09430 [Tannerellaceae bacterium]|nr:hypothetical protein [Tannerellaceae bacterium]